MQNEITPSMKTHSKNTTDRCGICYPPGDLMAFFNIDPRKHDSDGSINFVFCSDHSKDEVQKKGQELKDLASQHLGYPLRVKLFRGPPRELAKKLDATRPPPSQSTQRRVPYRQADRVVRGLRESSPESSHAANERLKMSANQMIALSSAFAEIEVAISALTHVRDALVQVPANQIPTQDFKKRVKGVRVLKKKMQQLADEEEKLALEDCNHPEDFVPVNLLYATAAVQSEEELPQQRTAINAYMDRFFASDH